MSVLFNLVLNWVLSALDPELGVTLDNGERLSNLAFADDVAIVKQQLR